MQWVRTYNQSSVCFYRRFSSVSDIRSYNHAWEEEKGKACRARVPPAASGAARHSLRFPHTTPDTALDHRSSIAPAPPARCSCGVVCSIQLIAQ